VQGTRVLQVGHNIIMADRMAQSGALRPDVTTTLADYGEEQVNRDQTTGAGHTCVASGTRYIIMADRMAQSGALRPDVTTTVPDYGDEQVNQEQTTGARHKGHAIIIMADRISSIRCTTTRCNNNISSLWR
jgi:hypothetical protein